MEERRKYAYDGPVMLFDRCITNRYVASTYAVSESKARCNMAYQYKKSARLTADSKITLPGKVICVDWRGESK